MPTIKATGRVLLVDDDKIARRVAQQFLEDRLVGVEVVTATDAPGALQLLEAQEFQAVVADFRMPGMDGLELLQAVRDRWPKAGRIMLTASEDVHLAVHALNEQLLDFYLLKPVRADEFAQAVARCLLDVVRAEVQAELRKAEEKVVEEAMALARSLRDEKARSR